MPAEPHLPTGSWVHAALRKRPGELPDWVLSPSQCETSADLAFFVAGLCGVIAAGAVALFTVTRAPDLNWLIWVAAVVVMVAVDCAFSRPRTIERKARAILRRSIQ